MRAGSAISLFMTSFGGVEMCKMLAALCSVCYCAILMASPSPTAAEPAMQVLGRDFAFPNRIEGLPARLSEFRGLEINSFVTGDGVRLSPTLTWVRRAT
jgi:hypothetical protein